MTESIEPGQASHGQDLPVCGEGREAAPGGGRKPPLLILAGPTAVGKTGISIALADRLGGECISADSVQVYRGLDIGSAKATAAEREGVPHHLIDILPPDAAYDVKRFQEMAADAAAQIHGRGHLPILVGGTGFYIQALLYGIDFGQEADSQKLIRQRLLREMAEPGGPARLYQRLLEADPASCQKIHPHNQKRIIRALEFYELHHRPISAHNEAERKREPVYDALFFVLYEGRERLYARIDARVDQMMAAGFLSEVRALRKQGVCREMPSMQGIGYKELNAYLDGECTEAEAVEKIKQHSRNYAKRQMTWFRRERGVIWVDRQAFSERAGAAKQKEHSFPSSCTPEGGVREAGKARGAAGAKYAGADPVETDPKEEIVQWIIGKCTAHWG